MGKVKKTKKWKKGHSSDSNPEIKKHRLAARNRFFTPNTGPSSLTVEALAKHDEASGDMEEVASDVGSDARTTGGRSFTTWASNWTECTNATFSRVHRYFSSNSAMHKEILAVLAAVTEVIKSQGGKETETEYFAALMTTLETVEEEQSLAAVAYLLSLALKRVPVNVQRARFSEVAQRLLETLGKHANSEVPALIRSLLVSLASLLRVQEPAVWSSSSTLQIYRGILAYTTHPKPRVRRAAHHAVKAVLKGSVFMTQGNPPPHHPAASATAKYCIQQIQECGGKGAATVTLHILGLLKDVAGVFPHHSLKSTCESILRVMTLSNVIVTSVAMQALHGMFLAAPPASCLPAELNAQLITAMYDFQPGENDSQPMSAWLAVMQQAHVNLVRLDPKLCVSHLPRLFKSCMMCLHGDKQDIPQVAARTLKSLLRDCVAPVTDHLAALVKMAPPGGSTPAHTLFQALEGGLSYQYHATWGLVLQVLQVCFEILGKSCHRIMRKCLLSLADLRDSHQFAYKTELDFAVGAAVRTMGPRIVLEAIPLNITGEEQENYDFPRSWLIPVLRDNIRETELAFFTTYFLPLAAKLRNKSLQFAKEHAVVQSKTYNTLQTQMWALLPGFCIKPTDLKQSFKGIAKILGSAITDRADLRMEVMSSLRKLISQNLDHDENRAELGRFAKNFLPLFFNLFTAEPEQERDNMRLAVLETVKVYLQVTDKQLLETFFDRCLTKLEEEEDSTSFKRHALMDLARCMIPYIEAKKLTSLYRFTMSQLESTDHTVQKKAYRILEEVCACQSSAAQTFVTTNLTELQENMLNSLSSSSPSSKGPRLRCLTHMVEHLVVEQVDFLLAVVPEAILCTKAVGERARAGAYALLVEMCRALLRWQDKPQEESVFQYFQMLMAGLGGSPHMVACTVLAMTRVLHEFKGMVSSALLSTIVATASLLLTSRAREVVGPALALVRVLLAVFPDTTLAQFLQTLVPSLVKMKENHSHHFRMDTRKLFVKLVRKFGYPTIHKMTPESIHKQLVNIRKTEARMKKKQKMEEEEEEEDGEEFTLKQKPENVEDLLRDTDSELEDDDDDVKKGGRGKKSGKKVEKRGQAWLKEGGDQDIVDFLDSKVAKKVMASKPEQNTDSAAGKVKHDFKTAPDGRLIIRDDSDEEMEKRPKSKPDKAAEVDDLDELLDAMDGHSKKSRKRKLRGPEAADEEEAPMKYQAGGSGIHRPLAASKRKKGTAEKPAQTGEDYRAKKAGGDIKRKGKPDPFAYIPLKISNLNRRKKAKMSGQFKGIVRGAQKGARKGKKLHSKGHKK